MKWEMKFLRHCWALGVPVGIVCLLRIFFVRLFIADYIGWYRYARYYMKIEHGIRRPPLRELLKDCGKWIESYL